MELEATAYHEAGHAVMAFQCGRAVRRVSIVADAREGSLGHVRNTERPSFRPDVCDLDDAKFQAACIREILITLAGPAAEERFTGEPNPIGATADMEFVHDLAFRVCGPDEAGPFLEWLTIRARNQVARRLLWVQVEGLARSLLVKPVMTGKEAREVCAEALTRSAANHHVMTIEAKPCSPKS